MHRLMNIAALIALCTICLVDTQAEPALFDENAPLALHQESPEDIPGVTTLYRSARMKDGATLRVFITRPDNTQDILKPLLFTQWVSCSPLHYRRGGGNSETFAMLARHSGLSLVRVERSGSGDSTGVPCSDLDFDTEVSHYQQAFEQVLNSGEVDPSAVFFYGSSLGSNTAPLVAKHLQDQGFVLGGIAVQGGGAQSYLERMLSFEKHYLDRRPDITRPHERTKQYQLRARFLVEYLVNLRHPDDIASDNNDMAEVRRDILGLGEDDHYGRPFKWHQQAAQRNFTAAWRSLAAPVLIIYNEFDQYEDVYGATLLADTVNLGGVGKAKLVIQKKLGHSSWAHNTAVEAYANSSGVPAWSKTAGQLTAWFHAQVIDAM